MDKKVLILSDEPGFALSAMRLLAKGGFISFLGTQSEKNYARYSRYCKGVFYYDDLNVSDFKKKKDLLDKVIEKVTENDIELILPLTVEWILFCSEFWNELSRHARIAPLTSPENILKVLDEKKFYQFSKENNIPVPKFKPVSPKNVRHNLNYPLVTRSGIGKRLVRDRRELGKINFDGEIILQEYIFGTDIDVSVVAKDGKILHAICQVNYKNEFDLSGLPAAVKVVRDEEALNSASDIVEKLNWSGLAHIDMRKDEKTGKIKVFEINPRLWASHLIAYKAGRFNVPLLSYGAATGELRPGEQSAEASNSVYTYVSPKYIFKNIRNIREILRHRPIKIMPILAFQDFTDLRPIVMRIFGKKVN